jgi:putative ABC transport system permease protein
MAFFLLIFKSAFRNRLRTLLTSLGVSIAIVAFLFLRTFIAAWYAGADAASVDRMVVRNKIAITSPLPRTYVERVKAVKGVTDVTWASWFAGVYLEPKNFFAQFATDGESYYRLYPEFHLPADQMKAWLEDRTGAVVGDLLAEKYGWKIGDRITLQGTIYQGDWTFTLRGIYTGTGKTDRQQFHFHWKYLDEKAGEGLKDQVGIILAKVDGPAVSQAIDKEFANSLAETRTETERAFQLSFLSMVSTIIVAVEWISRVVLLILILILGNTMAMATRERTYEYASMRAIGFTPRHVVMLVLGEGFVVAATGVAVGVGLAPPILKYFADIFQTALGSFLGEFAIEPKAIALAIGVALIGGMVAAAYPAYRAGRMRIVDALRRVE